MNVKNITLTRSVAGLVGETSALASSCRPVYGPVMCRDWETAMVPNSAWRVWEHVFGSSVTLAFNPFQPLSICFDHRNGKKHEWGSTFFASPFLEFVYRFEST